MADVAQGRDAGCACVCDRLERRCAAAGDTGRCADIVLRQREHDATLIDARNNVGYFLQIRRNMAREQNAATFFAYEVAQDIEHVLAGHRVEPGRRFVEYQQFRVVCEGECERELHPHPT